MSESTTFIKILLTILIVVMIVATVVTLYQYTTEIAGKQLFQIDRKVTSSLESELIEIMSQGNPSLPIPSILSMIDRNPSYLNEITVKTFVEDSLVPSEIKVFTKENSIHFTANGISLFYYLKDYFCVKGGLEVYSLDENATFYLTILVRRGRNESD